MLEFCSRERHHIINEKDKVTLITFDDANFIDIDICNYEDVNFQTVCITKEDLYKIYNILKEQDSEK